MGSRDSSRPRPRSRLARAARPAAASALRTVTAGTARHGTARHGSARHGTARPGGFRAACSGGEAPSVMLNGPGHSGCVRSGGPRRARSPARCAPRVPGKRSLRPPGSGRPGWERSAEETEAFSQPPRAPPGGPGRSVSRAEEPRGTAAGSRQLPSATLRSRELLERCEIGWKCTGWEGRGGAFLKAARALSRAAFSRPWCSRRIPAPSAQGFSARHTEGTQAQELLLKCSWLSSDECRHRRSFS